MVNLELYRVFYTVAKCGSLTRAAEELFISQPAVSQAIKQLEGQLDTPLFNRTHRGMELSEQGGKQIFDIVERALGQLETAENKLKEINQTATGTIRISASDTIFSYVLIDKIAEYHAKFPSVKLNLVNCITTETLDLLKNNKCDIAFLNLPIEDRDINLTSVVMPLHDIFVANENYAELSKEVQPLNSMHDYPLLMLDKQSTTSEFLHSLFQQHQLELVPEAELSSNDLLIDLARIGLGVAFVPDYCVPEDSDELFIVETRESLPQRELAVVYNDKLPVSPAVTEFLTYFNELPDQKL